MNKKFQILLALIIGFAMGFGFILPNWNILAQDEVTVTITSSADDPTNTSPIPATITFSEEVSDFEASEILVGNGDVSTMDTEDDIVYEIEIIPVDDGVVSVFVPAGVAEDTEENTNEASNQFTITYDSTPPTVEITTDLPTNPTGISPIPITITFSEEVTGFGLNDIDISQGEVVFLDLDQPVTTLEIEPAHYDAIVSVSINGMGAGIEDLAGNPFTDLELFTITYINSPFVTIEQAEDQNDPTSEQPILFTVQFTEPVTGFDDPEDDVVLSASTTPGDLTAVITGEGDAYTVSVSGMTDDGDVIASIPVGAAFDDDGNPSLISLVIVDNEVEYIAPPPTVLSIERLDLSPTKALSVNYLVTFSEAVQDVDEDDFDLTTSPTLIGTSISEIQGSGDTYVVTVLTGSGYGSLRLDVIEETDITDLDDNPLDEETLPYEDGEYYFVRIQSFADVPTSHWGWQWIERLYHAGVTSGCSQAPLNYCPNGDVTRAEMAKFLLAALYGEDYEPPALGVGEDTGFNDVPSTYWAAAWIKQLATEGITSGCGGGNYCPDTQVTRAEMAKFLLTAKNGSGYTPPALGVGGLTGFTDVPADYWAAAWIKQLAADGLTDGCAPELYCPEAKVSRAEMAKFLVSTFELP